MADWGWTSGMAAATASAHVKVVVGASGGSWQVMGGVGEGDTVGVGELDGWMVEDDAGVATAWLVAEGAGGEVGAGDAQPATTRVTADTSIINRREPGNPIITTRVETASKAAAQALARTLPKFDGVIAHCTWCRSLWRRPSGDY